jgi:hypothetical protein
MNAHSQSCALYLENENAVVFATEDPPYILEPFSIYITILLHSETKRVIGVRFIEFHMIAQNLALKGKLPRNKSIPLRTILVYALRMSGMPLKRQMIIMYILRRLIWKCALSTEQQESIPLMTPI